MKIALAFVLALLLILAPDAVTARDPAIVHALSQLERCSPEAFSILSTARISWYDDNASRIAFVNALENTVYLSRSLPADANLSVVLAHEARHLQQARNPINRIRFLFKIDILELEQDAGAFALETWKQCRPRY